MGDMAVDMVMVVTDTVTDTAMADTDMAVTAVDTDMAVTDTVTDTASVPLNPKLTVDTDMVDTVDTVVDTDMAVMAVTTDKFSQFFEDQVTRMMLVKTRKFISAHVK